MGAIYRNSVRYTGSTGGVDDEFNEDSTNPVQNKVITEYLNYKDDFQKLVNSSEFTRTGMVYGCRPGYLRLGNIPKKVVFIGNSMTFHGPRTDIEYTVYDYREMAASKPNSGWVALCQQYLKKLSPDVRVYKSNGATWETATAGSRTFADHLATNTVAEVTDSKSELIDTTLDGILDEDVDIIVCQLYENASCSSDADADIIRGDYMNLYDALKEKCPSAKIYQFCGFWQNQYKNRAVTYATARKNVQLIWDPMFNPIVGGGNITGYSMSNFEIQTGDSLYDADGNVICTVSSSVAGHPNDWGFRNMALYTIFNFFNELSQYDSDQQYPILYTNDTTTDFYTLMETNPMMKAANEIFLANTSLPTYDSSLDFDTIYKDIFSTFCYGGRYNVACFSNGNAQHGEFQVIYSLNSTGGYACSMQIWHGFNTSDYSVYKRRVVLASSTTTYGEFIREIPYQASEYTVSTIYETDETVNNGTTTYKKYKLNLTWAEDTKITNSGWTAIFKFSDTIPVYADKPRFYFPWSYDSSSPTNQTPWYDNLTNKWEQGIRLRNQNNCLFFAFSNILDGSYTSFTIPAGTIMEMEFLA